MVRASKWFLLIGILTVWTGMVTAADSMQGTSDLVDAIFEPNLTVAASFEKETVFNAVSTVSVMDRPFIERHNFATVSEALNSVAGISVWRTYLKKRIPMSRGILQEHYANKVLVMINNIPVWNAVTGEGDLDRIAIQDVERIEVLKGPGSVLYGSNAYTGAINLVLKKAPEGKSTGEWIGGVGSGREGYGATAGSYQAGGWYATGAPDYSLFLSAGAYREDWPEYAIYDEQRRMAHVNEYLSLRNLTAHGNYRGHSFLVNSYQNEESYLGTTPLISGGLGKNQILEGHLASYQYDFNLEAVAVKYSLAYDWERRNTVRTADGNTRSDIVGSRLVNLVKGNYKFLDHWHMELGGEHEYRYSTSYSNYLVNENQLLSENNLRDRSVTEWSTFGQVGYDWEPLKILLGGRRTQNQNFGDNVSARGSVIYSLNKSNSLKLIAGQSYRSPSLFELYFATQPVTVFGNPDLKPETSNSVELAYVTSFDRFFVQFLGYYATYENTIFRTNGDVVFNGVTYPNTNVYKNAERFTARGTELEITYTLPETQIFLNGNYILGDDGDRVQSSPTSPYTYNFKYIPTTTLAGGVSQTLGDFFLSSTVNYFGKMTGPVDTLEANYWVNANAGYRHGAIVHSISAKNITHRDVYVPEYVRRTMNGIPLMHGTLFEYSVTVTF